MLNVLGNTTCWLEPKAWPAGVRLGLSETQKWLGWCLEGNAQEETRTCVPEHSLHVTLSPVHCQAEKGALGVHSTLTNKSCK